MYPYLAEENNLINVVSGDLPVASPFPSIKDMQL